MFDSIDYSKIFFEAELNEENVKKYVEINGWGEFLRCEKTEERGLTIFVVHFLRTSEEGAYETYGEIWTEENGKMYGEW